MCRGRSSAAATLRCMEVFWSPTLPNWIMALSALAALGRLFFAVRDRKVQAERDRHQREQHLAAVGDRVWAHWVKRRVPSGGKERWGVLVTNSFHGEITNVEIACPGNAHEKAHPNRRSSLPTGRWVFRSGQLNDADVWSQAMPAEDGAGDWTYIARGNKSVDSLRFRRGGVSYVKDSDGRTQHEDG